MSEQFAVKKVKEFIKRDPITITPDKTLKEAAKLMKEHGIGFLPVVDDTGDLIGVLSERDIAYALADGLECERVEKVMKTRIISVKPDDTVAYAARLLSEYGVRHLVVVDEDGKLVGVFSIKDLTYGEGALFNILF